MLVEIVAILALTIGIIGRFKYVWQGNKIRDRKSSKDISDKFIILSWVTYGVMLVHNYLRNDIVDILFWFVGFFTSLYAMIMAWKYSEDHTIYKIGLFKWFFNAWKEGIFKW